MYYIFFKLKFSSFLGKVVIEEAVENRVRACAGHAKHVTDEEGQHHLL
jgi:hypothetical protein